LQVQMVASSSLLDLKSHLLNVCNSAAFTKRTINTVAEKYEAQHWRAFSNIYGWKSTSMLVFEAARRTCERIGL
jgi:hypothetical protein